MCIKFKDLYVFFQSLSRQSELFIDQQLPPVVVCGMNRVWKGLKATTKQHLQYIPIIVLNWIFPKTILDSDVKKTFQNTGTKTTLNGQVGQTII